MGLTDRGSVVTVVHVSETGPKDGGTEPLFSQKQVRGVLLRTKKTGKVLPTKRHYWEFRPYLRV